MCLAIAGRVEQREVPTPASASAYTKVYYIAYYALPHVPCTRVGGSAAARHPPPIISAIREDEQDDERRGDEERTTTDCDRCSCSEGSLVSAVSYCCPRFDNWHLPAAGSMERSEKGEG